MIKNIPLIAFIVLFAFYACQQSGNKKTTGAAPENATAIDSVDRQQRKEVPVTILDSLNKYRDANGMVDNENLHLYINTLHKCSIGLVQISDTSFVVYQNNTGQWFVTDTLPYGLQHVTPTDLNGDKYPDLVITYNITGAGGNSENITLMYDPVANLFKYNKYYSLPNIQYDNNRNLVYAAWWAGAVHPQEKWAYYITGDSLILKEGVTYIPDDATEGEIGTVEYYYEKKGKRMVTKSIKTQSEKAFALFSKALWDTSDQ